MRLTVSEQKLLETLPNGSFFTGELRTGYKKRYLAELLCRLAKKGALIRLKNGQYFKGRMDPFTAGMGLSDGGYVGFASALKHYGLLDEELSRVFIATENKRGIKDFPGFDAEFVPIGEDFYGVTEEKGVRYSTRAKTFFDCFKKPAIAGGYGKLLEALRRANLAKTEWEELLYYLQQTKSGSLRQRTGLLLEGQQAPGWFLKKLCASLGRKSVVILAYGKTKGFSKKWGVYHGSNS
ncbi:hypothetical protein HZC09_00345 [Candidatus Micrarchaeota archaeon]|nr:hypothetical protein [Candidatus Micrarchaeota archaeon]